jgi:hypothetical protein
MDEVRDVGLKPPQQTRKRNRHAELLRANRKLHGLDPVGDELRVSRHGGDTEILRNRRELAQQLRDVGLVAGSAASEHIRVDEHERPVSHCAASR